MHFVNTVGFYPTKIKVFIIIIIIMGIRVCVFIKALLSLCQEKRSYNRREAGLRRYLILCSLITFEKNEEDQ